MQLKIVGYLNAGTSKVIASVGEESAMNSFLFLLALPNLPTYHNRYKDYTHSYMRDVLAL